MERSIELAHDGHRIVARNATGLTVASLGKDSAPVAITVADLHAFACVGDQVWVVAGSPATLTAHDVRGAALASVEVPPPGTTARLVAGAGLRAAWLGEQVVVVASDGGLGVAPLPADVDFALPVSATRTIIASRNRVSLREQDTTRWTVALAGPTTVVDAALVLDGKAIALAAGSGPQAIHTIIVLGLRDGATLHRLTVENVEGVRFAAQRGVALLHTRDSRLVLVDLRFGRVLVDYQGQRAIAECAIDAFGRELALRSREAPDEVVHITIAELLAAAARAPAREEPPVAASPDAPPEASPPGGNGHATTLPAPARDPFAAEGLVLACPALPVRPAFEPTTATETSALLARHRDLAFALAGVAIARAWDEGRLAYPQTVGLPFHSEVSGLTTGQRGLAIEELAAARQRLSDVEEVAARTRRAMAPRVAPFDALVAELGLSPIARDLVLLIAAPSLWGEIARLYGILSNDEGRPLVDELLLSDLLAEHATPAEIARELDDDAPLVRHGIVRVQAGRLRPFLPLLVDPVVLRLVRGGSVEPVLAPAVVPRTADRTFEELRIPTAAKHDLVAALQHAGAPLRIVIRGRVGAGRHTLLAVLAATSHRRLGIIDAAAIVRDAGRASELAVALERAQLAGMLPCVDGLEAIASHDVVARDRLREVLRHHPGPLAVRLPGELQPLLDPGYVLIDLPALTLTDRLTCWRRTLDHHGLCVGELDELGDRYAVGPGVIERVAGEVARAGDAVDQDAGPRLEAGIRQHLENRLGGSANRVARLASWAQVILPADIQDSLTELIARIKHRRIVFDTWGFDHVMSTSRGVTALFSGGPGTGKTLVASAIANELGMDLYRVDLSRVMSKWIGETEQNLARLFDAAEDGNAIILFDEADSLFAKRTEVKSSVDRYANLEVNYLLQRIDTFEGIAILTTNFGTSIDSAFKRRLSLRLTFPFPDEEMREKLWRAHLPAAVPTTGVFDLAELARRYQLSGGYIRNAALRAAFLAAEEHSPLTQDHLERAIKAEFREIGKIAESGVLE